MWLSGKYSVTHKASHLKDDDDYLSSQNYFGALSKYNVGHFLCGPKTYMIFLVSEKKVNYKRISISLIKNFHFLQGRRT